MPGSATFHFDPICPWTWLTSRWLTEVSDQIGLEITWQSFSLALLHDDADDEVPAHAEERMETGRQALRIVQHLADAGRNDEAGRFYRALGTALHPEHQRATPALVEASLRSADLPDVAALAAVGRDPDADGPVRAAHDQAVAQVGPDVGSPVIVTEAGNAIFGPIVSPIPRGKDAVFLWEAVEHLADCGRFFELKRQHTARPDFS